MNNKNKNTSKRKDSHSRQHASHLRSSSKSTEKSKNRSDSKLLLRLKQSETSQLNTTEEPRASNPNPNAILARVGTAKKAIGSSKQVESSSNQYYNHYRLKSKSKGKLIGAEQQVKAIYLNSIYMHKQSADPSNASQHEHLKPNTEESHHSSQMLNKIRLIERNGAIDANGKFVVKDISKNLHDHPKNADSLQTISMFQGERKRPRKKEKTRKQIIKTKKKEEGGKNGETSRLAGVKSAQKFVKKRDHKEMISPNGMLSNTLRHYDCHLNQTQEQRENPYKGKEREEKGPGIAPILSTRTSKTILSDETQTSPQLQEASQPSPAQQVNLDDVIRDLSEDKTMKIPIGKLKQAYAGMAIQRIKCIEFLSKLCVSLSIRREAHSLAILYMDRFVLLGGETPRELRLVAMTALLMALKIDDGIMSRRLCHEYSVRMEMILSMSTKGSAKSKSIMKYKDTITALTSKETSATPLSKSKSMNSSQLLKDLKKSRKEQGQTREMALILQLELQMLMRFGFKLVSRSSTYWIDVLTLLWDDYVGEEAAWEAELLFRSDRNRKNLSHCYQMMERAALELDSYLYPTPLLALSSMYLVLRMRLEEQRDGAQEQDLYYRYAASLAKSTNLIFYDSLGLNQLFGDFLGELELALSEMIECIQFMGKMLTVPFRTFAFSTSSQYFSCRAYEHQLSIYESNPDIYKFVEEHY